MMEHSVQTMANKKALKYKPQRTARYYYLRFIRLKGDPCFLARGVAIGLFIGATPLIPFHTILTLFFAFILRGSKLAAILAGFAVSNPLTLFFQYYFSWRLGSWLTGSNISWERINAVVSRISEGAGFVETFNHLGKLSVDTIFVMVAGGCVLAAPIAAIGYVLSLRFFSAVQRKRQERQQARAKQ
jgi:uncharacterized protein (DUF2062 family)